MAEETKTATELAAEHVIADEELVGKGVSAQSNPMELPEDQAKAVFDQIAKEIIIPAYNAFVLFVAEQLGLIDWTKDDDKPISKATQDALNGKHNKELRTNSTEDNPLYRVLSDNNFTDEQLKQLAAAYEALHKHGNKTLLDALTQQDINNWNGGNVLTLDNTTPYVPMLPYHPATVAYVDEKVVIIGAADMQKRIYDPNGREEDVFAAIDAARYIVNDVTGKKYYWGFQGGNPCLIPVKEETEEVSE